MTPALLLLACMHSAEAPRATTATTPSTGPLVLRGGIVDGQVADVVIDGTTIAAVGEGDGEVIDVTGRFLVPAFIDSHVHLAYLPRAAEMADGGIAAAVDLAAPLTSLPIEGPPKVLAAGPMITAVGGYPTQSWGAGGYGYEVADVAAAEAAVDDLVGRGVAVIKIAVTGEPTLTDAQLAAVVERAHDAGLKVAAHALGDEDAARAAAAGADLLAHTPVGALSDATIEAWSGGAVVSTLRAFGGSPDAIDNLRRLREAGATVLYGTDFGNTSTAGIDSDELALLAAAGLDPAAVLAAGTSVPAAYWALSDLGALAAGKEASLLVLGADPTVDPAALAAPERVFIAGAER